MKSDFLRNMKNELNLTTTENGAVSYKSTNNAMLDAFGSLGAMRFSDESDIIRIFSTAFYEDQEHATKLAFYIRDIRGGQGQRRVFRTILKWMASECPNVVINNMSNILFYGRGDDYMCLLGTNVEFPMIKFIRDTLNKDSLAVDNGGECSLLAKWLPSENTSSPETVHNAKVLMKHLGMSPREYRKILSKIRKYLNVTEVKMSGNQWGKINYEHVPAKASMNYSDAFFRHDREGYVKYLRELSNGNVKVNAASLFPVDIIHNVLSTYSEWEHKYSASTKDRILLDAMWKALPNYLEGKEETGICVVDTSGSMNGTPIEVAISLGMYCADKCHGPFKNHFITFSEHPELQNIRGKDIFEKVDSMHTAGWQMNTNLEAVFDLILHTAVVNNMKQEDVPSKLYIISDMQFDQARGGHGWYDRRVPFMQTMREKFEKAGYKMPSLIYWNVRASKCGMFHETFESENVAMVSGYSASLFKSIIDGTEYVQEVVDGKVVIKEKIDPVKVMLTTLDSERYSRVVTGNNLKTTVKGIKKS